MIEEKEKGLMVTRKQMCGFFHPDEQTSSSKVQLHNFCNLHSLSLSPASQACARGARSRRETRLQPRLLHKHKMLASMQKMLFNQVKGDQKGSRIRLGKARCKSRQALPWLSLLARNQLFWLKLGGRMRLFRDRL